MLSLLVELDAQTWLLVAVLWCAWIGFAAGVVSLAWWVSKFSLRQVLGGAGLAVVVIVGLLVGLFATL